MLPVPSVQDLATFTGQPTDSLGDFASQALAQATLMFSVLTRRETLPEDPDQAQLAVYGIMQMAQRILLEQPYAALSASPLQSETIGSYSYSKTISYVSRYASRTTTDRGLYWWELAIEELSLVERSLAGSGSIEVFHPELRADAVTGQLFVYGPAEDLNLVAPFDVNGELNPRPRLG